MASFNLLSIELLMTFKISLLLLKVNVNVGSVSSLYNTPSSANTDTFEYAPEGSIISFALLIPEAVLLTDLTLIISCDADNGTTL